MHWFIDPIKNHYADFEGRVGRQEFWMFILFSIGLNIILEIIGIDILGAVVTLAIFIPNIALTARRLHDTGRSGWWQLLWLIPIIGWIIIIVFLAQQTTPTVNQFGSPAQSKVSGVAPLAATPVTPVVNATDASVIQDAEEVSEKSSE